MKDARSTRIARACTDDSLPVCCLCVHALMYVNGCEMFMIDYTNRSVLLPDAASEGEERYPTAGKGIS